MSEEEKKREEVYSEVTRLSMHFAKLCGKKGEEARDFAADAVAYVIEHEDRFDPAKGFKFITFAGAYMRLYMLGRTRKMTREKELILCEARDVNDNGLADVTSNDCDAEELAVKHDEVEYLRRVLFPILPPASKRVFDAILAADSAHAQDLIELAGITSEESIDVHKTAIRKAAKSKRSLLLKNLGRTCKERAGSKYSRPPKTRS